LGDRPPGGESDRTLRVWIDDIAYAEDVAEDRFDDVRNRSILEIERVTPSSGLNLHGAGRGRVGRRRRRRRAEEREGLGRGATSIDGAGGLRVSRLQIGRSH